MAFAVMTMVYTGVLLGANRAFAFWSTALLPMLFLISAVSTGLMATVLLGALASAGAGTFDHAPFAFLGGVEHRAAGARGPGGHLLPAGHAPHVRVATLGEDRPEGRLASHFWFGVVLVGILVPLAIEIVAVASGAGQTAGSAIGIALMIAVPGLVGGLILRYVVLGAGVRAPLKAAGIEYTVPTMTFGR